MEPLIPDLPEDLTSLSDEELAGLKREHQVVAEQIEAEDAEFLQGMSADDVLEAQTKVVEQTEAIVGEEKARKDREESYLAKKSELAERRAAALASESEGDDEGEGEGDGDEGEDGEGDGEEAEPAVLTAEVEGKETEEAEEGAVVVASAETVVSTAPKPALRRPPAPRGDRLPSENSAVMTAAAGLDGIRGGQPLDRLGLAEAIKTVARRLGPPAKSEAGIEQRFFVGQAVFPFPDERRLMPGEADSNARKIQA
ncbi:MAG: hypothetical protein ACRD1P_12325, partial [Thermoanaerobaculia bacterium]